MRTSRSNQRLAWLLVLGIVFITTVASAPGRSIAQTATNCRAADTERVPPRLAYLRDLVSSSDSATVAVRQALGIQQASANKVTLVSRQRTCADALAALDAVRSEPHVPRDIWLYTWGVGYAIDDPTYDVPGSDPLLFILDKNFVYKSGVMGF